MVIVAQDHSVKPEPQDRPTSGLIAGSFERLGLAGLGRWQGAPIALLFLIAFLAVRWSDPSELEWLRLKQFDVLQSIKPREWKHAPVVIVDIDEASLAAHGQWPWPRHRLAALIDKIAAPGPLAIGLDFLFSEPDRLSPDNLAAEIPDLPAAAARELANMPSNDIRFGESFRGHPVVVGVVAIGAAVAGGQTDAPETVYFVRGDDPAAVIPHYQSFLRNVPAISRRARGEGVLNSTSDVDGIVRRVPLLAGVAGKIYPSLTLEVLRVAFGEKYFVVHSDKAGVRGISIADFFYPTAPDGQIWLHYTAHQPARYVSAKEVLAGGLSSATFANRIVLLGTSSAGLLDLRATPLEPQMAGVEIHAQVLEMLAPGHALTRPGFAHWMELAMIALAGLAMVVLIPMFRPVWSPMPAVAVVLILAAVTWYAYDLKLWLIDSSLAIGTSVALLIVMSASTWAAADRQRRQLDYDLGIERAAAARIQGELEAARRIQMGILPRDFPAFPARQDFDLHALIEPARSVGGDLYDFALLDEDHLFFMVGDVSGKGVPASLFMALSKALYKSGALRRRRDIARIMTEVNKEIYRENPQAMFVTVLAGILDLRTGLVECCNAGHDTPYLARPGSPAQALHTAGGPPLGILEDFTYTASEIALQSGDFLVSSSDGVSEAMNDKRAMFTLERIEDLLRLVSGKTTARELVEAILRAVHDFAAGAEPSDDITILAVKYIGQDNVQAIESS